MRGSLAGSNVNEKPRGKKAKRRYDVALNTPGVEIRLPSLPRIALGWRILSGFLVVLLAAGIYFVWSSPLFKVESLQVEGLRRLSSEDLNTVADVIGQSVLFVEPARIQRELLKAFPELSDVTVEVQIPASVVIKAVERQPIIAWKQGKKVLWIDSSGIVFPRRGDDDPSVVIKADNLPFSTISSTPQPETEVTQENQEDSLQVEPDAEPSSVVIHQDLIQTILVLNEVKPENIPLIYDEEHGLGWKDSRGWQVYFGTDTNNIEMKLNVYKAIAKRLKKEGAHPSMISVENVHAPYYRVER
jgi:cell division protein FtsQ